MRILVTGGRGMLGRTLESELSTRHEITAADLPEWDVTDADGFIAKALAAKPDVIIHAAAMTRVDDCEGDAARAFKLNEEGTRNAALAAKACGARLIAVSTDYVFSGEPPVAGQWAWGESDLPRPATVYGESKLAGERMARMILPDAVVLRIAWLYGSGGPSFVHTMMRLGSEGAEPLKVVDDQCGNPTSCLTVARAISFLLERRDIAGVVHSTCEGQCSWYAFACEIKKIANEISPGSFVRDITACTSEEFVRPARRPRNSALKKSVLNVNGYRTAGWREALAEFMKSEFSPRFAAGTLI